MMERVSVSLTFLRRKRSGLGIILAAACMLFAGLAQAQNDPATNKTDFPTLKGSAARSGRNGDTLGTSPGMGKLSWYVGPNLNSPAIVDNTDVEDSTQFSDGPYDPNPNGKAIYDINKWVAPSIYQEASNPYVLQQRLTTFSLTKNNVTTQYTPSYLPRAQSYVYSTCVPSDPTDVTKGLNVTASTFEWDLYPSNPAGAEEFCEVYAYLPIGPTDTNPANNTSQNAAATYHYAQRYYVYKIVDGNGNSTVDVVDTDVAGYGFVRLGNGGQATDRVFSYTNSKTPIKVILYNTVPRDSSGKLYTYDKTVSESEAQNAARFLVYADAAKATVAMGQYTATPTVAGYGGTDIRVTAALNRYFGDLVGTAPNLTPTSYMSGEVTSYAYSRTATTGDVTGAPVKWTWRQTDSSLLTLNVDDDNTAVTQTGWTSQTTATTPHQGADYLTAPITTTDPGTAAATYKPELATGSYEIYVYLSGDSSFDKAVKYQITEDTAVYNGVLDESQGPGWVRLGGRRFQNVHDTTTTTSTLSVKLTNLHDTTVTATPSGTLAYADAVRFVGAGSLSITSTPVHATINLATSPGNPVATNVVLVGDEQGVIHCLDETGNSDGTTTEYWSYPSTKPAGTTDLGWDPNQGTSGTPGPDGYGPQAHMPSGFNLSTAIIKTINGTTYMWISGSNGRVYCIDMTGRGDYVAGSKVGTAQRVWTWPDDYRKDLASSGQLVKAPLSGVMSGSLVFGDTADGAPGPTIYVPAAEGRIYALNAVGDSASQTTSVRWAFPAVTQTPLAEIQMTPSLDFGNLYFGTLMNADTDGPGVFYAISAQNGKPIWSFDGVAHTNGGRFGELSPTVVSETIDDFASGPATVPGALMDLVPGGYGNTNPANATNTVYVLNQNRYVYGFDAATGKLVTDVNGQHAYRTNELGVGCTGNLGYSVMQAYDNNYQSGVQFPIILVPTQNGRFVGLFARPGESNIYTTPSDVLGDQTYRSAYGVTVRGQSVTSIANASGFLYGGDSLGFLYAFTNVKGNGLTGDLPATTDVVANNPSGIPFRQPKMALLTKAGYQMLRTGVKSNDQNGPILPSYGDAFASEIQYSGPQTQDNRYAFEWGQTVYILVYDIPFTTDTFDKKAIAPPVVNVTLSVEGKTVRQVPVDSLSFKSGTGPKLGTLPGLTTAEKDWLTKQSAIPEGPDGVDWNTVTMDGYAVVPFTFQSSGPNQIPPGNGTLSVNLSTAFLSWPTVQTIDSYPLRSSHSFVMANPLGVSVPVPTGGAYANYQMGALGGTLGSAVNAADPQNLVNGSPFVASASEYTNQLLSSGGYAKHGQSSTATFNLYDRSLMVTLTGRGLGNVRVDRRDLRWQGGSSTVMKQLDPSIYLNFEDYPVNYPNNSLDYPDIARENVQVTKDPLGTSENPLLNGVTLIPPTNSSGVLLTDSDNPLDRLVMPTRFDATINVPRYQPPVDMFSGLGPPTSGADDQNTFGWRHDSAGQATQPQGYFSRIRTYVDAAGVGRFSSGNRDAYRALGITTGVVPDMSLAVNTPTLDLGSQPQGAGYSPAQPGTQPGATGMFDPWVGSTAWKGMFKSFEVRNEGNVNLLHLRVAKKSLGQSLTPLQLGSDSIDQTAWLDGTFDVWSDMDKVFAPQLSGGFFSSTNTVALQKARVADTVPTTLSVNPIRRANPVLGVSQGYLLDTNRYLGGQPRIAVTVPIGFPVGTYSAQIAVIEEQSAGTNWLASDDNETWIYTNTSAEPKTDPGLTLTFTIRESRLTSDVTPMAAQMIDAPGYGSNKSPYMNMQPAAMRNRFGALVLGWSSNRPNFAVPKSTNDPTDVGPWRIYLSTLPNQTSFQPNGPVSPTTMGSRNATSPLQDLNFFKPTSANAWFSPKLGPFPTINSAADVAALFPPANTTITSETPIYGTERFGAPAFPNAGDRDPFYGGLYGGNPEDNAAKFDSAYMAFVGDVQKQTPTGRVFESRLFLTTVGVDTANKVSLGSLISVPDDLYSAKGKASIVQTNLGATVYYPATSGNRSQLYYAVSSGSVFQNLASANDPAGTTLYHRLLNFGPGFQSVTSPNAVARPYNGGQLLIYGNRIVDMVFLGKLVGRANEEPYLGRIPAAADGSPLNPDAPFAYLSQQTNERLVGLNGSYRARGVQWNRKATINLIQVQKDGTTTGLIKTGTVIFDQETGLIVADTTLGGKVYLDPSIGSVRFSSAVPLSSAELRLTYTPGFLRLSDGSFSGNYTGVTAQWDWHFNTDPTYWRGPNNSVIDQSNLPNNDRYWFTFGGAAGQGTSARPHSATMRLGIRLPVPMGTGINGGITITSYTGNTGPMQVDPARGMIYLTSADEDRPITVQYTSVDGQAITLTGVPVSFVAETPEQLIPIEQAVNESDVSAFLDPFSWRSTNHIDLRRPSFEWLFYTSTRAGGSDLYMQTIATRFAPFVIGK